MAAAYRTSDATVSARGAVSITPNDSTVINNTRALYIGVAGNLKVTMVDGQDVTFLALAAGTILPIQVTKVFATGTTITGTNSILVLY
jgi:hypothetical protein